jgi:hypothetical protein
MCSVYCYHGGGGDVELSWLTTDTPFPSQLLLSNLLTPPPAPGAKELATVYKSAGSPKSLRGFSTNVAGWNSFDLTPGEFANSPDGQVRYSPESCVH